LIQPAEPHRGEKRARHGAPAAAADPRVAAAAAAAAADHPSRAPAAPAAAAATASRRRRCVAVQVAFERHILKPVFHLIGYRLWV
jgi:hypothetical protein